MALSLEFTMFETKNQFVEHYEKKLIDYDNLCRETKESHCML